MDEIIDQAAYDEAQSIVRDKQNPKHEAYHRNDKRTVDYVSELFSRATPGTIDLDDKTPEALRGAPDSQKAGEPGSDPTDADRAAAERVLIEEWGDQAAVNVQMIGDMVRDYPAQQELESLSQDYGIFNDPRFLKLAHWVRTQKNNR